MKCVKCEKESVIKLQDGFYCKDHFIKYFEKKVLKTIKKYKLFNQKDYVCVAVSGGKDSLTMLNLVSIYCKKQNIKFFALNINEGIDDYREHSINDLKEFCEKRDIEYKIISFQDNFSKTLDEIIKISIKKGKKPCTVCGVLRRYLLNYYSRFFKSTVICVGHNLDDNSQVFLMNVLRNQMEKNFSLGPITGVFTHDKFIRRVKPLYFVTEKEVRLYCLLKNINVKFSECPYVSMSFRSKVRDSLNKLEYEYPGVKNSTVSSFLDFIEKYKDSFKEKYKTEEKDIINKCKICGEPTSREKCNTCSLIEELGLELNLKK